VASGRGTARTLALIAAAALVPGLGHALLGLRRRALAFFALVFVTFGLGIALDGALSKVEQEHPLTVFAAMTTGATGALNLAARAAGRGAGDPASHTFEYGTAYLLTAGLMNLLLILDTFDRVTGRRR
jgi:hypothetical protein